MSGARRIPKNISNTAKLTAVSTARRLGKQPSQTEISVMNVPDYSTPQGAAMANEEMRRLQLKLKEETRPATETTANARSGSSTGTKLVKVVPEEDNPNVETEEVDVKLNGKTIVKDAEAIDFVNPGLETEYVDTSINYVGALKKAGIKFEVTKNGEEAIIKGNAYTRVPYKYVHTQTDPSLEWYVNHKLGTNPTIEIIDFTGVRNYAYHENTDMNNSIVKFNIPMTGMAYCF